MSKRRSNPMYLNLAALSDAHPYSEGMLEANLGCDFWAS
jgi:hypothetical protein